MLATIAMLGAWNEWQVLTQIREGLLVASNHIDACKFVLNHYEYGTVTSSRQMIMVVTQREIAAYIAAIDDELSKPAAVQWARAA